MIRASNSGRESNFGASLYHLAHPQHTTSSKSTSSNDTVQLHQRSSKSSSSEKTVTSDDPEKVGGAGRGEGRWIDDSSLPDKQKFIWWYVSSLSLLAQCEAETDIPITSLVHRICLVRRIMASASSYPVIRPTIYPGHSSSTCPSSGFGFGLYW
jgi:hypothetical protein